jgi:transposase
MGKSNQYYNNNVKRDAAKFYHYNKSNYSIAAVIKKFNLQINRSTLQRWYHKYMNDNKRIKPIVRPGRPPLLNRVQVNNIIRTEIKNHNTLHHPISSRSIQEVINKKLHIKPCLRTIQHYIKSIKSKSKTTIKRTKQERNDSIYMHINY